MIFIRGNWEISRGELNNPRFIAMVSTDRNFLDPDYNEFTTSTSRSMMCCRSVAIIVISSLSLSLCANFELYLDKSLKLSSWTLAYVKKLEYTVRRKKIALDNTHV